MIDRRKFMKTAAAIAAGSVIINPFKSRARASRSGLDYFSVHPFVDDNPDAVFILRTDVDVKTNSNAIRQVAREFGRSVLMMTDDSSRGVPITHNIVLKPNTTSRGRWQSDGYTVEGTMGVVTDVNFCEGIIEAMEEFGIAANQFYMREASCGTQDLIDGGYIDMAQRTGISVENISSNVTSLPSSKVQWVDVPDGQWFNKLPFLWPTNSPDSWLMNLAKLKTHTMGVTLCAKNLQGLIAPYYQQHCSFWDAQMNISSSHIQPNAKSRIKSNYDRHVAEGIPRWDRPGQDGGLWMETWGTRNLDNNMVTKPGLHVIEGIYSRDGHFVIGPNDGYALDYMSNLIIFGKKSYNVDVIGTWLAGHEPGNFGLFHMAKERGLSDVLNPLDIPIYEWSFDGSATRTNLSAFDRTPLKTFYLQRDYGGQNEDYWHLCNEPYEYETIGIDFDDVTSRPRSIVLNNNYPNPFNPSTSIEYLLPQDGNARLEIFNSRGEIVDVLVDKYHQKGAHMVVWNSRNRPSGTYFYRLRFNDFSEVRKMTLVK